MKTYLSLAITFALAFHVSAADAQERSQIPQRVFKLTQGVNFGNMLEAPSEGAWGLTLEERFFDKTAEAGFKHIRLPVSWTHHAAQEAPYTIDETFFQRVDWALDQAAQRGISVLLNNHHYDELNADPVGERERALAIWTQIAERYRSRTRTMHYEILNEPHGVFNDQPQLWNQHLADVLAIIRQRNPNRKVIVGPVGWNSIERLDDLVLPKDDDLIVTVHYYSPFPFTHQGASWVNPIPPVGTVWTGNKVDFNSPWQNWSWNTDVQPTDQGLEVDYLGGWAGLRFHSPNRVFSGVQKLRFTINKAMTLRITAEDGTNTGFADLQTADGSNDYEVNLPWLVDGNLNGIVIQNHTPDDPDPVMLSNVRLVTTTGELKLTATELEAIQSDFRRGRDWANERRIPIYLGEFGAYEAADYASRVRWTTAVRESARNLRYGWAYWELAAGFGVFDPKTGQWRTDLLRALIPQ